MAQRNYEKRADERFARACERIASAIQTLTADHAVKGLLRSGPTAKKSVTIFEEETSKALSLSIDEMGKHIDHRGASWNDATAAIGRSLERHLGQARSILEKPLGLAGATGDTSASRAVDALLGQTSKRLRSQLAEFSEGWTSPAPKPWKERHPNWDRLLFLVIGAAITGAIGWMVGS